jgi:hypothetical protein
MRCKYSVDEVRSLRWMVIGATTPSESLDARFWSGSRERTIRHQKQLDLDLHFNLREL